MSLGTFRKVKASMMIVMLSVAEGHRIQVISSYRATSQAGGAARVMADPFSKEQAKREQEQMEAMKAEPLSLAETSRSNGHKCDKTVGGSWKAERVLLPEMTLTEQMDASITDPGFKSQAKFLAEQVESMMANANMRGEATLIAEQMDAMMAEPTSVKHSARVSELMEAMINDPKFQEWAMRVAKQMGETIMRDARFLEFSRIVSEQMEAMKTGPNANEEATLVQMMMAMSDPHFQEQVTQASQSVEEVVGNPTLQQQAVFLAEKIEAMKDGSENMEEATQVVTHVDLMMADPILQAQAQILAEQMVAKMEHSSASGQTNLSLEQLEAMKAEPLALVEVNRSSGQDNDKAKFPPLAGGALKVRPLSQALPSLVGGPMLASGRDTVNQRNRPNPTPLTLALENERGPEPWMSMTGTAAHTSDQGMSHAGLAPSRDSSGLTSAKGLKMLMPALIKALPDRSSGPVMSAPPRKKVFSGDAPLLLCFALWYIGGFYYNINNKLLAKATGAAFPMTIATLQLGVSLIYSLVLWMAPNGRQRPDISFKDYIATLPIGAAFAGAHLASIFTLTLGAVSFAHIVRSAEPAFAAVIGTCLYGAKISIAKWFTLVPVIGGIVLASIGEVNFAMGALVTASLANVFNAIRGNEVEKLLCGDPGISERIGSAGNVYSIMILNSFLFTLPLMLLTEGKTLGQFWTLMTTNPSLLSTLGAAGLGFTLVNEFGTRTVKRMGTVSNAVARTAARVIFIVVSALMLQESLGPLKLFGASVSIGGVFLYNIIDNLAKNRKQKGVGTPPPELPQTEDTAFPPDKPRQRGVRIWLKKLRQR